MLFRDFNLVADMADTFARENAVSTEPLFEPEMINDPWATVEELALAKHVLNVFDEDTIDMRHSWSKKAKANLAGLRQDCAIKVEVLELRRAQLEVYPQREAGQLERLIERIAVLREIIQRVTFIIGY